jgi:hypothetical protein
VPPPMSTSPDLSSSSPWSSSRQLSPPNSSWQEQLLNSEAQRLADLQTAAFRLHEGNKKDDTTPWFKFTQWPILFEGKDLKVRFSFLVRSYPSKSIGATRFLRLRSEINNPGSMRISERRLKFVSECLDQVLDWTQDTLVTTSNTILRWLRHQEKAETPFHTCGY